MRTLLLSSSYFPIRIISWQRAVKMRFEGTADVVAEYSEEVSSPSTTWKIPAVIRERKTKKVKHAVRYSKQNMFLRDRHTCQYCNEKFPLSQLNRDHVVPRSAGGKTTWENTVTSCLECNSFKGNRECDDCGMFPINQPVRPKTLPQVAPRIDRETAPVEWLAYLPA